MGQIKHQLKDITWVEFTSFDLRNLRKTQAQSHEKLVFVVYQLNT